MSGPSDPGQSSPSGADLEQLRSAVASGDPHLAAAELARLVERHGIGHVSVTLGMPAARVRALCTSPAADQLEDLQTRVQQRHGTDERAEARTASAPAVGDGYDPEADDRIGYCTAVVFGDGIDTNDVDGHNFALAELDPDEVLERLDGRGVTDNDGHVWTVRGTAPELEPADHCERLPVRDLPVNDAFAVVVLADSAEGATRHAVAYCETATVAEVLEHRETFAGAWGHEMPDGVLSHARSHPPTTATVSGSGLTL